MPIYQTYDLIASTTAASGTTITLSFTKGSYRNFIVQWKANLNSGTSDVAWRLNGDSGSNYGWTEIYVASSIMTSSGGSGQTWWNSNAMGESSAAETVYGTICLFTNSLNNKVTCLFSKNQATAGGNRPMGTGIGLYNGSSALSSISMIVSSGANSLTNTDIQVWGLL